MVIDHLEPGGAQRQFCLLATALRRGGGKVDVLTFRDDDFFAERLQDGGAIPVVRLSFRNLMHLMFILRRSIRDRMPDVVISFLSWPNLLVELAGLPSRDFALVVSDRNLDVSRAGPKRYLRYLLHRTADIVVSNSYAQRDRIAQIAPYLNERTVVIPNGVDTDYFVLSDRHVVKARTKTRVLVLARYAPQKNVLRFIKAAQLVRSRHPEVILEVDWYGKKPVHTSRGFAAWDRRQRRRMLTYYRSVEALRSRLMMNQWFRLHGPSKDVRRLYGRADVVCLPSVYEGCSNVIGEAMACGVPILAGRVSDNVRLVEDGRNGFLFDPTSVEDIAAAIVRFAQSTISERRRMGRTGRDMAQTLLSNSTYVGRYIDLIQGVVQRRRTRRE